MTEGMLTGMFGAIVCIIIGVMVSEYFHFKQDTRDGDWTEILRQQQRQIDGLLEYIADHSEGDEVGAEELGYD